MTTVTKTEKKPTNQQKNTRNRRRHNTNTNTNTNHINHGDGTGSRVRRKGGCEQSKKRDIPPSTKPVIGSSNPFFIAVCAPETYVSNPRPVTASVPTPVGVGNQRVKSNVFLRTRPNTSSRSSSNIGPNHFIHHPTIQHSRQIEATSPVSSSVSASTSASAPVVVSFTDLNHFPSLGGGKSNTAAAAASTKTTPDTTVKLNFKEIMMKGESNSGGVVAPVPVAVPVPTSSSSTEPKAVYSKQPVSQKQLSSNNIFLAAFHSPQASDDYDDDNVDNDDHDYDVRYKNTNSHPVVSSSVLIDTCDNKYDRLYR